MKAILDCNSFYCSCERVFKPWLDKKPVVVLSNNDGCIIARSNEAKTIGIGMTGPFFLAKPLIEKYGVEVFSSNYNLYGDMSWRVMEVLKTILGEQNVEVYSVDEAFLNLDGFSPSQLHKVGVDLKETVEKWTGVKVSVGMAPTKTLAKLANRISKSQKDSRGVLLLDTEDAIREALQKTDIKEVWGIGRQYKEKLFNLGITTAWQLRNMPEEWVRKHIGGVTGVRLVKELKGKEAIVMNEQLVSKKMITTTRMFGAPVTALKDIKEAIATYTSRAAEKLRRQQSAASVISAMVVVKEKRDTTRFKHGFTLHAATILPHPTCLTADLLKPAMKMAEDLFQSGKRYAKAGITLSGLVPDTTIQANLFEPPARGVGRFLMEVVDNINFSMRNDIVKFASSGTERNWKMQQNHHSPRYTTRWNELCEIQ